jgi:hypothetical protein
MTALEELYAYSTQPFNIEGIGALANLRILTINLISPAPSLEFMRDMPNLQSIRLEADSRAPYAFPLRTGAYQILDLSPLAMLKNLKSLACRGFIIKNISALDVLDTFGGIDLVGSRLYDETEKSRHRLSFENVE